MTKTTTIRYVLAVLLVCMMAGATVAYASEVTGTLSSDASSNTQTAGNISGTVSGGSSSGGSSSSGGRRSNSSSVNSPSGAVLGASTDGITPSFPNAGFAPEVAMPVPTLWSAFLTFVWGSIF